MDAIYENFDLKHSTTASGHESSQNTGQTVLKKDAPLPKRTKVLLIALSVSLAFALAGVCTLAMLLTPAKTCEHDLNATVYKERYDALHGRYEETYRKLSRINNSTGCALCAVDWIHSGGKCYYFSTVKMNWTQSRDHCLTLGGHLVMINSRAEQDFLTSNVKQTHWIGLNDLDTEGLWLWVNNQPLNDSLQFWMKRTEGIDEPDNWTRDHPDGEDCASLGHPNGDTDFWTDAFCFEIKRFVCEAAAAV